MPDFAVRTAFTATDRISPAFKKMGKNADVFGSRASRAMNKIKGAGSGLMGSMKGLLPMFGVAAVVKFGNESIKAFEIQEAAIANVEAGLKSTNNAIGVTSNEFQKMAEDIQKAGIFGDEAILQNVTAQMLTFGNIGKSNFQRVQTAVVDVTAKLKGMNATSEDLRATSIMLGKAMDDPARGMSALRRVGISFSTEEANMVKAMVKANNTVGAQNMMLKLIEKQYGGTNKAISKTAGGMDLVAKNKIGDTMELIGKQIMPLKKAFIDFISWILPKLNAALPKVIGFLKDMAPILKTLIGLYVGWKISLLAVATAQKVIAAVGWIKYLIQMNSVIKLAIIRHWAEVKALVASKIAMIASKIVIIATTAATIIWQGVMIAATAVTWAFGAAIAFLTSPIGIVIIAIGAIIAAGVLLYQNWEVIGAFFTQMWTGIKETFTEAGAWISSKFTDLIGFFINKWNKVKAFFGFAGDAAADAKAKIETNLNVNGQAPNAAKVQGQKVNFTGNINVNAPKGTEVSSRTVGSKPINMKLVGQN